MKLPQSHRTLAMTFFAAMVLILGGCSGLKTTTTPTLTSIAVTPASPTIGLGATEQFTATGTYSDNSMKDLTATVTWGSKTPATATISATGLATSVAIGTSEITATDGTISGNTTLTVTAVALASIRISPANPTIPVGGTVDFTGIGVNSDGTTVAVPNITWNSGTPATASIITTTGVALGLTTGTSTITATGGGVTGTTTLTVGAAASRFAYVANGGDGTISIYAVNGSTFTPRGYVYDANSAIQVIPDPSGRFLFALNGNASGTYNISTYMIDPIGGGLTDLSATVTPVVNGTGVGFLPYEGTLDPTGRFLYVANNVDGNVTAFSVNTLTGALTEIGSPVSAGNGPTMVLTDRSGAFLYVVNNVDGTISGFAINGSTGALTGLTTTPAFPAATGNSPFFAAIDPTNTYLYVGDYGDDTVAGYTINKTTGALTAIAGSPFSVSAGAGPYGVAFDPATKFLYVGNFNFESVSGYSIGTGGALGASLFTPLSSSPTGTAIGSSPFSLSIDPAGTYLTIANQSSNTLALFSVNAATGVLTSAGSIETRQGPEFANIYISPSAPTLAPSAAFVANSSASTISEYTSASSGALTPTAAPATAAAAIAYSTTDISGNYLYTSTSSGTAILAYNVTQSTAALSGLSGSPYSTGANLPSTIVPDPSDRFVFAAASAPPGAVLGFTLDTTTNSLNPIAGPLAVSSLNAMAGDPQGQSLYALGVNLVEVLPVNYANGVVTAGSSLTTTGTWVSGAVDAAGQYLVALDGAGKNIQVFSVGPLSTFATVGGAVSTGGTAPASLVMDPLNRFIFVADSSANLVSVFSFNAQTGAVAALGTATPGGPSRQIAVDATGKFLYVAVEATPVTNAGTVAVYSIGSTGTLTAVTGSPFAAGAGTSGVAVSNSIK